MATAAPPLSHDAIAQRAEPLDLELDDVAATQQRAALGSGSAADGARSEHLARAQLFVLRDVRDHLLERPVDRLRAGLAPGLAVHPRRHPQVVDVGDLVER